MQIDKLGLIAGNGRFPFLVLEAARGQSIPVVIAAIREETDPALEQAARNADASMQWMSLGELSKLIQFFKSAGITTALMAGQVKHKQIFSSIRPDWRLAKVILGLATRNTDSLIGAVAKVLEDEGIHLISSTVLLEPLLARSGVLTRRPNEEESRDIAYGRDIARKIAGYDIGQTVIVAAQACVAIEAMEGTDAAIRRAGDLMRSLEADASTFSRTLTVVKVAKPNQDMRFDVPVVGVATIDVMHAAGATCLALDAGKCLLIDGPRVTEAADRYGISVTAD